MSWREKWRNNPDLAESIITTLRSDLQEAETRVTQLEFALQRIRDGLFCQSGSSQDRIDALREIASEALNNQQRN